ncbi:hypothetical protein BDN72DRAFT_874573 [Pluteus cervinus]|uniref:Uncharacterized protein n=1 Tax=Pluteus cervinus TaxID=181527 RepID=A0ACD3BCI0_9AGAR|nr:hypothetical protein BDN72DRAFT_874573 [Pluteus cervinus]
MFFRQNLTRRDALLVMVGASCVYLFLAAASYGLQTTPTLTVEGPLTQISLERERKIVTMLSTLTVTATTTETTTHLASPTPTLQSTLIDLGLEPDIPETSIVAHAPGWTLFRNLYMSNGTLFLLTSDSSLADFPEIRMMTSTGLEAQNTPENIAAREPTKENMDFISPADARARWGGDYTKGERNRVWTVEGNTLLFNDPPQFLNHYYHFVAELLLGTWAFIYGAFHPATGLMSSSSSPPSISAAFNQPSFNVQDNATYQPPPFTRAIFIHSDTHGWRDSPGFNAYFLRAVFPALTVEVQRDWEDRVMATVPDKSGDRSTLTADRAWHFPIALLTDRSAAHRGVVCGSQTQRTAAEAWHYMVDNGGVDRVGAWWGNIREAIWRFASATPIAQAPLKHASDGKFMDLQLADPGETVITYISRQSSRRRLIQEDHEGLVTALEELVNRKRQEGKHWELNIVQAERMTKDEQVRVMSKSTILLGVHGNGLTHLVLMQPTRVSAVVEIFFPGGFAHDYEWTSRALGMRHFSVWNDTYFTHPNEPRVDYPEGFQGISIPVYGPAVAKLVEDQLEHKLPS